MAKKQRELNTSVEVTFKNGDVKIFSSLEEAAKGSGLSEGAIKIRCNKSRQGSCNKKDKINCRWIDDTTFRHYQAKKSKNKGSAFETEIVEKLKSIGYDDVCRAASESKKLDNNKIDISGSTECAFQAKHTQTLPNYYKIREACIDERPLVLLWKKSAEENSISKGKLAIVDWDFFFTLLKNYHNK